jgi:hypothetical protein
LSTRILEKPGLNGFDTNQTLVSSSAIENRNQSRRPETVRERELGEVAMLARHLFGACTVLVSALVTLPATAQDRPQDYHRALSVACSKEINGQ